MTLPPFNHMILVMMMVEVYEQKKYIIYQVFLRILRTFVVKYQLCFNMYVCICVCMYPYVKSYIQQYLEIFVVYSKYKV